MNYQSTHRGFTLIEAIIYLALFSILMGGATVAAYYLFDSATKIGTRTLLQEESDFVVGKIEWVLSGTKAVTAPAEGTTGSSLTVSKWDTALGNPVVVARSGSQVTLTLGSNASSILNNTNTTVERLTFTHVKGSGDGLVPEAVETVITLTAYTPTGASVSRTATSTVYLRH